MAGNDWLVVGCFLTLWKRSPLRVAGHCLHSLRHLCHLAGLALEQGVCFAKPKSFMPVVQLAVCFNLSIPMWLRRWCQSSAAICIPFEYFRGARRQRSCLAAGGVAIIGEADVPEAIFISPMKGSWGSSSKGEWGSSSAAGRISST